ncbi:MAG: SDR family NAD(P)-dependent oxidoreductase [Steroidobacteraceae bacterium]
MTLAIDLTGRAILCVGATKGIARACVESMAQAGAALALVSRDTGTLERLGAELREKYRSDIMTIVADATDDSALKAAIASSIAHYGNTLSGLAPLVGSWNRGAPLHELTDEDWLFGYERILLPVVRSCRYVLPHFVQRGGGSIVTLGAYSYA